MVYILCVYARVCGRSNSHWPSERVSLQLMRVEQCACAPLRRRVRPRTYTHRYGNLPKTHAPPATTTTAAATPILIISIQYLFPALGTRFFSYLTIASKFTRARRVYFLVLNGVRCGAFAERLFSSPHTHVT
jgi:hypothetical protein